LQLEATPLKNSQLKFRFIFAAKSLMIDQQRVAGAFRNGFLVENTSKTNLLVRQTMQ